MSESEAAGATSAHGDDHDEEDGSYKPPAEKSLNEIINQDQDDDALKRYKDALLGNAASGAAVVAFPDDPRQVIVRKLALLVDDRDDMELDLTKELSEIKKKVKSRLAGCLSPSHY